MLGYFRNRQKLGYLVGSFLLVLVIFAFIVFYIPDFLGPGAGASLAEEVARVEGRPISSRAYLERYRNLERAARAQLGERFSPALMRQLGLEEAALQPLIQEAALAREAERLGLRVTDEEVSQQILTNPGFQSGGQFIGRAAYLQILAASRITAAEYEEQLRAQMLLEKLRLLVTGGVLAGPEEVEREYRRRNEKAKLEYVFIPRADFEKEVAITEPELAARFQKESERYRLPVQRKIRFVQFGPDQFRTSVTVSEREIERYYNENLQLYESPEQVRASHILFKTAGKDEAEVRGKAEVVLAELKAGAEFSELARKHSEDTSAAQGGDLGFFSRGEMLPEFEEKAFSLAVGEVSEPLRTSYGFHIIKVAERRPPLTQPLESVRDQIRNLLIDQKAEEAMRRAIEAASSRLATTENLEGMAQQYNLIAQESPFFSRQDPLPQLGGSAELRRKVFELPVGKVAAEPIRVGRGFVFLRVLEERPPHLPSLEEVKERVRTDLLREKALARARARAVEVRARLAAGKNVATAAKAAGVELKTAETFYRDGSLPELGRSPAVAESVFTLEPGSFSEPLPGDAGYVVLRAVERGGYSPEKFASERESFSEQLLNEKRTEFWAAYVQGLMQKLEIQIHREALRRLTG